MRNVYYFTLYSLALYFFLFKLLNSADKLKYDLDNFFVDQPSIAKTIPGYPQSFKVKMQDPEVCTWQRQSISWHWALDGLFKPINWFDKPCSDSSHYKNLDFSVYDYYLKGTGKSLVSLENIDKMSYPVKWTKKHTKVVNFI